MVCVCTRECTAFFVVLCWCLRRHPPCCGCQGELALADRMGPHLLVRLVVSMCISVRLLHGILGGNIFKREKCWKIKKGTHHNKIVLDVLCEQSSPVCVSCFSSDLPLCYQAEQPLCWLMTSPDLIKRAVEWHHHITSLGFYICLALLMHTDGTKPHTTHTHVHTHAVVLHLLELTVKCYNVCQC